MYKWRYNNILRKEVQSDNWQFPLTFKKGTCNIEALFIVTKKFMENYFNKMQFMAG